MDEFSCGLKKGINIALGYLAVSFAYGVFASDKGLSPLVTIIISLTNLSSAGQFSGTTLIVEHASLLELCVTILLINLRYVLMSLSLSQRIHTHTTPIQRVIMGFGNTDEIFSACITDEHPISFKYMFGVIILPFLGWQCGTILGVIASNIFSDRLLEALTITLYVMFIAVVVPACKKSLKITIVVIIAVALSCMFEYVPGLCDFGIGFKIIIPTIIAAVIGALLFPINNNNNSNNNDNNNQSEVTE